jgi:hypothetical protein
MTRPRPWSVSILRFDLRLRKQVRADRRTNGGTLGEARATAREDSSHVSMGIGTRASQSRHPVPNPQRWLAGVLA